ncbi:MAG: hypothetical protein IPM32_15545 [Ignavibacteriae bacterium]|nr:hypothetical protein [Ignavibacteriota bacterium]
MNLTFENIYSNISHEQLKTSQIIAIALGLGISLFFGVTMIMYYNNLPNDPNVYEEPNNLLYLKFVCILVFFTTLVLSYFQPTRIVKAQFETLKNTDSSKVDINSLEAIHRTYLIIRLAILEGGGLFGLVIFFLSVLDFTIYAFPIYWICVIPALVMVLHVILLFPTKTKVSNYILENLQSENF